MSASLRKALKKAPGGVGDDPVDVLSNREFQVLRLLATGATNHEIADQLAVGVKTINTHRLNILAKLGLRNNIALARFAMQHGIV